MATYPGLKTIDPIQGLVSYVQDIKPYHSKIFEVLVEYVYQDTVNVTIVDTLNLDTGLNPIEGSGVVNGQYWYDPIINILYLRQANAWVVSPGTIVVSNTAPTITSGSYWYQPPIQISPPTNTPVIASPYTPPYAYNYVNAFQPGIFSESVGGMWQAFPVLISTTDPSLPSVDVTESSITEDMNMWNFVVGPYTSSILSANALSSTIHISGSNVVNSFGARFHGIIAGTVLTVSDSLVGTIVIGQSVFGVGVTPGTYITAGSGVSWVVNIAQTVGTTILPINMKASSTSSINVDSTLVISGSAGNNGNYTVTQTSYDSVNNWNVITLNTVPITTAASGTALVYDIETTYNFSFAINEFTLGPVSFVEPVTGTTFSVSTFEVIAITTPPAQPGNVMLAIQPGSVFKLKETEDVFYVEFVQYNPITNISIIGVTPGKSTALPSGDPNFPISALPMTGNHIIPYFTTGYDNPYDGQYDQMAGYRIIYPAP